MGFEKHWTEKEYVCKQCQLYLDRQELINGKCPECGDDDYLFINDLNED